MLRALAKNLVRAGRVDEAIDLARSFDDGRDDGIYASIVDTLLASKRSTGSPGDSALIERLLTRALSLGGCRRALPALVRFKPSLAMDIIRQHLDGTDDSSHPGPQ